MSEHSEACPCRVCEHVRRHIAKVRELGGDPGKIMFWEGNAPPPAVQMRRGKPVVPKGCKNCHNAKQRRVARRHPHHHRRGGESP